ncbi:hypothetical protein D3C78_1012660 [compost metagenome]
MRAGGPDTPLQAASVQGNGLGIVAEQVDCRRAVQLQVAGVQVSIAGHGAGEFELEANLPAAQRGPCPGQAGQAEEVKTLGEEKVLLQDPVAIKDIARVGQQGFFGAEAGKDDVLDRQPVDLAIDVQGEALQVVGNPQVQGLGGNVVATEVKIQLIAAQAVE